MRKYFNGWVISGGILFALLLLSTLLVLLWMSRPQPAQYSGGTAVMNVLPLPTPTPIIVVTPATPTPKPGENTPPPQSLGDIVQGALVQVTGTGTDGLRLRSDPNLQGKIQFLAIDAEVLKVSNGPKQADGYTWWYLVSPYDEKVQGWAVADYLIVIQRP